MKILAKACGLLVGLVATGAFVQASGLRLSEPVQSDAASETFGQVLEAQPVAIPLADVLQKDQLPLNQPLVLSAQVGKVCQKKGCFFIAYDGAHSLRVSFKDYGFFVPTDISGRTVTLVGELVAQEVSGAQAEHYNRDLGQSTGGASGSVKPGKVVELVATTVRIPRQP